VCSSKISCAYYKGLIRDAEAQKTYLQLSVKLKDVNAALVLTYQQRGWGEDEG
jgi:hypothetical protein